MLLLASARFVTDVLWFQEVGIASVLWKSLRTQFGVGAAVGLITAAIIWLNLLIASKSAPAYRIEPVDPARPDPVEEYRVALGPYMQWIRLAIAGAIGLMSGLAASTAWQTFILWANRVSFGRTDPQFGRDIGFYFFELPFLDVISNWVWFALLASLFVSAGAHYFYGALRPEQGLRGVLPATLAHLSVLLGLLALVKAFQYWLGQFQLNFSARGTVTGASYTDVNAQLPALQVLMVVAVLSAILFLVNIRARKLSLPLAAIGIWVLVSITAGTLWPLAVQRFSVDPQEQQREDEFIGRNIEATREGFGLANIEARPYSAAAALTEAEADENQDIIQNVRLWDPGMLQRGFRQLQAVRPYYQFTDVDIDRYVIDGEPRQVMLSVRELSLDDLPEGSATWQNLHLQYTHGFGLVASLANEATATGQPSFIVRDIPGTVVEGAEALEAEQPRIYYGEGFKSHEYAIVDTEQDELDFALEDGTIQRSNYEGAGGIGVGNLFRRLAFAVREGDPNLLLTGLITGDSRIMIYRNVRDRIQRAAPFLSLDHDPYPAVVDGRIVWILDAYTTSSFYPYGQRFDSQQFTAGNDADGLRGNINYVRNSVKVVVDAYDGDLKLYVVDEEDPLIQTWRNAFPDLFTTDEPSDDLRAHFRYPEDMFRLQTEVYRTYHMTNPADFYSREDEWDVPPAPTFEGSADSRSIPPVYLLLPPPGDEGQEFVLTRPFVPRNRPNMISTLLARSDPDRYGEILSLQFPRSRVVPGPQQVENLINQDVAISRTRTLLGQQGSTVQFGNLIILPIADSVLYVQPMFVIAQDGGGIPELKRVVVVSGDDIVMRDTFDDALAAVLGIEGAPPDLSDELDDLEGEGAVGEPDEPDEADEPGSVNELIARAGRLYEQAQEALADGDFAEYGRLIEELGRVLRSAQNAPNN
jgi:uncharacterized membrane protein (UPF0182 family)